GPVPVAVEGLRKLLQDFNTRSGAKMSAIVSRSGVPVAWVLPDEAQVDNFATMAATLIRALELIYATMKAATPTHVTVESEGGILSVREVTGKMFFVAMATRRSPQLVKSIEELLLRATGFLTAAVREGVARSRAAHEILDRLREEDRDPEDEEHVEGGLAQACQPERYRDEEDHVDAGQDREEDEDSIEDRIRPCEIQGPENRLV